MLLLLLLLLQCVCLIVCGLNASIQNQNRKIDETPAASTEKKPFKIQKIFTAMKINFKFDYFIGLDYITFENG